MKTTPLRLAASVIHDYETRGGSCIARMLRVRLDVYGGGGTTPIAAALPFEILPETFDIEWLSVDCLRDWLGRGAAG